jgi:hypothetical protein
MSCMYVGGYDTLKQLLDLENQGVHVKYIAAQVCA